MKDLWASEVGHWMFRTLLLPKLLRGGQLRNSVCNLLQLQTKHFEIL